MTVGTKVTVVTVVTGVTVVTAVRVVRIVIVVIVVTVVQEDSVWISNLSNFRIYVFFYTKITNRT